MRAERLARAVRLKDPVDNAGADDAATDAAVDDVPLSAAGGLQTDEEEGRVERDHDVLSEPPEPFDTSRAETPPRRLRKGFLTLVVAVCGFNFVCVIVVAGALALGMQRPDCPVDQLARQVAGLNTSLVDLLAAVDAAVHACA